MISHWFMTSQRAIEAALEALPKDADKRAITQAVDSAYPFGERDMWPYKQWLKARKAILAKRFPSLFPGKEVPKGEGLFQAES